MASAPARRYGAGVDHSDRTIQFFSRWGVSYSELCASFRDVFSAACVWDQRPIAKTEGPDAAIRFMEKAHKAMGLATIDVAVLSLASVGDKVHTERVDTLRRADGSVIVAAPVAGVLTFEGDRLVHWREYFDAASFGTGALGSSVGALARGALRSVRRPG